MQYYLCISKSATITIDVNQEFPQNDRQFGYIRSTKKAHVISATEFTCDNTDIMARMHARLLLALRRNMTTNDWLTKTPANRSYPVRYCHNST